MMNINEIFPVIVLYKCSLEDSETIQSLENTSNVIDDIFVFDNSPEKYYHEDYFKFKKFRVSYQHDGSNPGLSAAYNTAVKLAKQKGYKWLLLMDQDTCFTESFFKSLENVSHSDPSIVAYMPVVKSYTDKNAIISPSKLFLGGFTSKNNFESGKQYQKVSGINSGTIINIDFIESLGGFDNKYPLDMLDHWYFREIYRGNKNVFILDCEIYQNLSVSNNYEANMSVHRYIKFIEVEHYFFKSEHFMVFVSYKLRLFFRVLKQLNFKDSTYYKRTLNKIFSF